MILALILILTAANVAGFTLWILETKRRRAAEDSIFKEIKAVSDIAQADLKTQEKILAYTRYLRKAHKFFKWRLTKTENRIEAQEDHFAKFGEFIAMLAETIPMDDPDDIDRHKERIDQLTRNFFNT